MSDEEEDITVALVALVQANIPVDVQELLVRGDPARGIAPGALQAALDAVEQQNAEVSAQITRGVRALFFGGKQK